MSSIYLKLDSNARWWNFKKIHGLKYQKGSFLSCGIFLKSHVKIRGCGHFTKQPVFLADFTDMQNLDILGKFQVSEATSI